MKRLLTSLFFLSLWFYTGCDFQNPAEFELPTWRVDLTIPLIDETYPLSNIVNDSTLHTRGDTIEVEFSGTLPADSISEDYLQLPMNLNISSETSIKPPDASGFFSGYTQTITLTVPVGEVMNGTVPNVANPPSMVQIPSSEVQKITGQSWNWIASIIEASLGDTSMVAQLFNEDEVFSSVPFIRSLEGIIIGGDTVDNFFRSSVENVDLPKNIDSSFAILLSRDVYLANHDTTNLQTGDRFDRTTSLVGDTLGGEIEIGFGFKLQRAADGDTITIPADAEIEMKIQVSMGIADLERAVVATASYSLAPEMDPIAFKNENVSSEACGVSGVYGGTFAEGTGLSKNRITISNVTSTYPFDVNFAIQFGNFVSGSDTLQFGDVLSRTSSISSQSQKLDGWSFVNPVDPDSALEEILVDVTATTVEDTVDIYLDGTEPDWTFSITVNASDLSFQTLEANLDCPFPTQTQEIEGIPQGFTGMSFGEVILQFTMYNQIRLPLYLDLNLVGVSSMGDSVTIVMNPKLGIPSSAADTAKTILKLSSQGTEVRIFKSVNDVVPDTSYTTPAGMGTNTIVDLLALNPSEIVVDATAGIDGRGAIDANAKIWGEFELIAPFSVRMDTITFVPVTSTKVEEMPHDTRAQIRHSLKGASLTTHVTNALPIGGELVILFSDSTIFPLDQKPETLDAIRDSLGWPSTDSLYVVTSCDSLSPSNSDIYIFSSLRDSSDCVEGAAYLIRGVPGASDTLVFFVDTLLKVVLPDPAALYSDTTTVGIPGMVSRPGDTTVTSGVDSNKIFLLTDLGSHYINTRTQFNGTEGEIVFFSMKDYLKVQSFMTFSLLSTGLFEEAEDEIIITYPNGGETLTIGEPVIIRWRSLGKNIANENIEVFLSTSAHPQIDDGSWTAITDAPIANADSLVWVPDAVSDRLWLKVCNESGTVRDMSGWYFSVASGSSRMSTDVSIQKNEVVVGDRKQLSLKEKSRHRVREKKHLSLEQ